ncbi:MAG: GNAT family protein [Chloroflexota bacterium]
MIKLIPFTPVDFSRLISWIDSPSLLVQWAGALMFHYPLDENQLQEYFQQSQENNPSRLIFTVLDDIEQRVGHIELGMINRTNGTGSICRVFIDPSQRGKRFCHAMVEQILKIGFDDLKLRRIDLRVYSFNTPAVECYRRAGLIQEGVLRKNQKVGDQVWDTILMGILREEWEGVPKSV